MCHILLGKVAMQLRDVEAKFCRPIFHIIWWSENAEQLSRCNLPLPHRRWSSSSLIIKQPDAILTNGQDKLMLLCFFYCKLCLCWLTNFRLRNCVGFTQVCGLVYHYFCSMFIKGQPSNVTYSWAWWY